MKTPAEWEQEAFVLCQTILYRFIDPERYGIFLFGSRAHGKTRRYSDIDIGLIGEKPVDEVQLDLLREAFDESDLLYEVAVIDFSGGVDQKFKTIALKNIIWWSKPANLSVSNLLNSSGP